MLTLRRTLCMTLLGRFLWLCSWNSLLRLVCTTLILTLPIAWREVGCGVLLSLVIPDVWPSWLLVVECRCLIRLGDRGLLACLEALLTRLSWLSEVCVSDIWIWCPIVALLLRGNLIVSVSWVIAGVRSSDRSMMLNAASTISL